MGSPTAADPPYRYPFKNQNSTFINRQLFFPPISLTPMATSGRTEPDPPYRLPHKNLRRTQNNHARSNAK
jgi:hypothetical protein